MTEGEIREIAFQLCNAACAPAGDERLIRALARLLGEGDRLLAERGIRLRFERVLPPELND